MEHVVTFVIVAMATILVTRLLLMAAGYPQLGGAGMHIAHVLWGGALLIVAMVALLLFMGPVVRPAATVIGGIGFGLFIDEVGKFLTDDNNYFYAPAFAIKYASGVGVVVAADVVASRRRRVPAEDLAAVADLAVSGLVGGFSARQRRDAVELLDRAIVAHEGEPVADGGTGRAPLAGAEELRSLLAAIPDDDDELPDPVRALSHRAAAAARGLITHRDGWRIAVWVSGAVLTASTVVAATDVGEAIAHGVTFVVIVSGLSLVAAWALWAAALRAHRTDGEGARNRALDLLRSAVAVNLLLTQVALFRFDPWQATALVMLGLVTLLLLWAEQQRRVEESNASSASKASNESDESDEPTLSP